jgi:uncharacterized caspase-like protein
MSAVVRAAALFIFTAAWVVGGAYASDRRVALVIGNAAYQSTAALHNTLNDADLMSKALRDVGFEVVDGRNLDKAGSDRALARFASAMQGADVTLFYFAGHGLQISGQNYLLPVDAQSQDEASLPFESVKLNDVIALLNQNGGVRIMLLDACRNNPFSALLGRKPGSRSVGAARGLARTERTQGMLVAYATQANETADDGAGGNSPFTQELVRAIHEPGVRVGDVFQNVVVRVHQRTEGRQTPEVSFSLVGEFFFNRAETEMEAWKKAAVSKDAQQLQAFIDRFPASSWGEAARTLMSALEADGSHEKVAEQLRLQNRRLEQALAGRLAPPPSPKEGVSKGDSASQPASAPPQQPRSKPGERSCSEILARIQLGEMTAADVDALKRCH